MRCQHIGARPFFPVRVDTVDALLLLWRQSSQRVERNLFGTGRQLLGVGREARPPARSWSRSTTTCSELVEERDVTTYAGLVADRIEKLLEEFD